MGSKQVGLLLTVVMLILAFDCGNCNTQELGKVVSIRSNAANGIEDSESVLHRDSRSVHRSGRSVLNSIERQQVLDDHNRVRRLVGASDMEIMTWSETLATLSEKWAQNCIFQHDTALKDKDTGQNIYAVTGVQSINITAAIQDWYNENSYYNYNTPGCDPGQLCGHYTQVVWATSREVGCAYWSCSQFQKWNYTSALIFVCDYSPAGNVDTQKPFQKGSGCSRCANGSWWCNRGLCDGSCIAKPNPETCGCAPVCLNFGSVKSATCSCSCTPGWYGSDCNVVCEDKDPQCDPKPNVLGYPPYYCDRSDYGPRIKKLCPKMCNQCQVAVNTNNYSTSTKPSLLNMLSVWLSWLLIYSFRSI